MSHIICGRPVFADGKISDFQQQIKVRNIMVEHNSQGLCFNCLTNKNSNISNKIRTMTFRRGQNVTQSMSCMRESGMGNATNVQDGGRDSRVPSMNGAKARVR